MLFRSFTTAGAATPAYAGINNYMNPYTNAVVDETGRLGRENLNNAFNAVNDRFIGSGGFGGGGGGGGSALGGANSMVITCGFIIFSKEKVGMPTAINTCSVIEITIAQ